MPDNLWIISELYYPEETSTGYLLTKIAEGLAPHYPVSVLCGQPSYSARGVRAASHEVRHGVKIHRCWATTFNKDVLFLRFVNLVTISLFTFFKALWQIRSRDYVLVVTNPPSLPLLVAFACRLRRAKCLLLIHDVYPEVVVAVGKAKPHSIPTRFLNWLNKRLYQSAERIIVVGRDMEILVSKKLNGARQRIVFIPNWADVDDITPGQREQNVLLKELGLNRKFILQCAGNMGYPNDIESILESAKILADRKDIHFLFIGSGAKKRWIEKFILTNELQNVTILPNRPRSDQSNFLNACDVAIITLVSGMVGISMPSRTYNTLASGKPVIGVVDTDSELARLIEEERVGWVVPPSNPEKLVQAILEARINHTQLSEMGARARLAAERKYPLDKIIEAYLAVIRGLEHSQPEHFIGQEPVR